MTVRAIGDRRTNAQLVLDLVELGHLRPDWLTLDCTFGKGRWWKHWLPGPCLFLASDLHTGGKVVELHGRRVMVQRGDFRALPLGDRSIDAVVFDGPYKLNGTPDQGGPASSDSAYGVAEPTSFADRIGLLEDGARECARVADKRLIVKCQDQVVSGRKVWQTRILTDEVERVGRWRLADMLHVKGYRAQPKRTRACTNCDGEGHWPHFTDDNGWSDGCPDCDGSGRVPSPQQHAAADYSTCLVFVPR